MKSSSPDGLAFSPTVETSSLEASSVSFFSGDIFFLLLGELAREPAFVLPCILLWGFLETSSNKTSSTSSSFCQKNFLFFLLFFTKVFSFLLVTSFSLTPSIDFSIFSSDLLPSGFNPLFWRLSRSKISLSGEKEKCVERQITNIKTDNEVEPRLPSHIFKKPPYLFSGLEFID